MKTLPLIVLPILCFSSLSAQHHPPEKQKTSRKIDNTSLLTKGPLPDLDALSADGKPIKLQELCAGKYTVLTSGCLTCPQFHKTYQEIEAANTDFKSQNVQFFYFYKSLRHPELNGYLQAQNTSEQLLQLAQAKKMLGTKVPWIADTLQDSMRIALGANSQSVYIISPKGEIIYASSKIDRTSLRTALTENTGLPTTETHPSDLTLPAIKRAPTLVNEASDLGVKRPEGLHILAITPTNPDQTYLVKLRAEADENLLKTGTGRLFLGFYPDPIHHAHWNNLTEPMHFQLTTPEGTTATPSIATAKKGPNNSDTQPRQFWVDISAQTPPTELNLKLSYFGCTPTSCQALTHQYTIHLEDQNRGARTFGMNRGTRSEKNSKTHNKTAKNSSNSPSGRSSRTLQNIDTNQDNTISFEEMETFAKKQRSEDFNQERFKTRFQTMDTNNNGSLSPEELTNASHTGKRPNH